MKKKKKKKKQKFNIVQTSYLQQIHKMTLSLNWWSILMFWWTKKPMMMQNVGSLWYLPHRHILNLKHTQSHSFYLPLIASHSFCIVLSRKFDIGLRETMHETELNLMYHWILFHFFVLGKNPSKLPLHRSEICNNWELILLHLIDHR